MRIALEVFLLLTLVISVQSKQAKKTKAPVDLCTIPVVVIKDRSSCHPLQKLWVLRNGKCKEALQCRKGYSKNECIYNCLHRRETKKPQSAADAHAQAVSYAESWASSFERLSERQKPFAKMAIEILLVQGQLEKLNVDRLLLLTTEL